MVHHRALVVIFLSLAAGCQVELPVPPEEASGATPDAVARPSATSERIGQALRCDLLTGPPTALPDSTVVTAAGEEAGIDFTTDFLDSVDFDFANRVGDGSPAEPGELRGIVQIQSPAYTYWDAKNGVASRSPGGGCTGTLIASGWVLTAAHCAVAMEYLGDGKVRQRGFEKSTVRFGSLSKGAGTPVPGTAYCHEGYSRYPLKNDIALIRLDRAAPTAVPVEGIAPPASAPPVTGTVAFVYGYGYTKLQGGKPVGGQVLTTGALKLIPTANACDSRNGILCARTTGLDGGASAVCSGDSGGPLFLPGAQGQQRIQIGVTSARHNINSYNAKCGGEGVYSSFTDLAAYGVWLREVISAAP